MKPHRRQNKSSYYRHNNYHHHANTGDNPVNPNVDHNVGPQTQAAAAAAYFIEYQPQMPAAVFSPAAYAPTTYFPAYYGYDKSAIEAMVRKQIEYYFSEENLIKDVFLRQKMDKDGYVPLASIASFHRIQVMTQDMETIISALKDSEYIDMSDNSKIRPKNEPLRWPFPETLQQQQKQQQPLQANQQQQPHHQQLLQTTTTQTITDNNIQPHQPTSISEHPIQQQKHSKQQPEPVPPSQPQSKQQQQSLSHISQTQANQIKSHTLTQQHQETSTPQTQPQPKTQQQPTPSEQLDSQQPQPATTTTNNITLDPHASPFVPGQTYATAVTNGPTTPTPTGSTNTATYANATHTNSNPKEGTKQPNIKQQSEARAGATNNSNSSYSKKTSSISSNNSHGSDCAITLSSLNISNNHHNNLTNGHSTNTHQNNSDEIPNKTNFKGSSMGESEWKEVKSRRRAWRQKHNKVLEIS